MALLYLPKVKTSYTGPKVCSWRSLGRKVFKPINWRREINAFCRIEISRYFDQTIETGEKTNDTGTKSVPISQQA